jgi:predicted lipoprotein with Yx(FWY)xxD motif
VKRVHVAICLPVVAASILAGCGSSSSKSTSAASPATTSTASSASATSSAAPGGAVVTTKHDKKLGTILAAGPKKLTVYLFEADKGSTSNCSGPCPSAWPPVTASGTPTASGQALGSDLGTIKRSDGTTQITYKGHPLYFFIKDKDSGDAYGEGNKAFGADWYVLAPSGKKIDKS